MKTYSVDYMYKNTIDDIYSDRLIFETEENARTFIEELKNDENIKKINYIYLTTTEKVV